MVRAPTRGLLAAAAAVLAVGAFGLIGVLALDPGFLISIAPGWFTAPMARGRALQVLGALLLIIPATAAAVTGLRGGRRAFGGFLALALIAALPAAVMLNRGAFHVRQAEPDDPPACVERSGGMASCPGG